MAKQELHRHGGALEVGAPLLESPDDGHELINLVVALHG